MVKSADPLPADDRIKTLESINDQDPVAASPAEEDEAWIHISRDDLDCISCTPSPISTGSLLSTIRVLNRFGAYSGWRHSTSAGEAEARAWILSRLDSLSYLKLQGMVVEETPFHTGLGIEFHESRVFLTVGGMEWEVDSDALPGDRDILSRALRFDSDGTPNDRNPDPVEVSGGTVIVDSLSDLQELSAAIVTGKIVIADYALFDRSILNTNTAYNRAAALLGLGPEALILVTQFSDTPGASHGTFSGDVSVFNSVESVPIIPILKMRIEDLSPAGISDWADFSRIESVRLIWDTDILSPGESAYLLVRIPGIDGNKAVILGAHYDSANSPGALDDGSGVASLLAVAGTMNQLQIQPPVDVYLVFFGSHERGLYGSSVFANEHSDLLDHTLAMLQIDCLTHPLDGIQGHIYLEGWPYVYFGNDELPWSDFLSDQAGNADISAWPFEYAGLASDNSSLAGYNVPGANLIFMNPYQMGEVHRDGHLHDPYDTVYLAAMESQALSEMAQVALLAATETNGLISGFRVTPLPDKRAVFVASHTEGPHMTPVGFTEFGMALAWAGWDVDTIPYGKALTEGDLTGASMVIVPPVHDYPTPESGDQPYDEMWTQAEVDILSDWVNDGGFLILTNSAHRLKYYNMMLEENEDALDLNLLASCFGVEFINSTLPGSPVQFTGHHSLLTGVRDLDFLYNNGIPFTLDSGQLLVNAGGPAVAILSHGSGEVLVLSDIGLLGNTGGYPTNLPFWNNIAAYADQRNTR
ncbi:MAG TPA: M28 family peptidase [Thermoanaerobaculia bacterium]|nr:M28 family peptidase [Thermoanaerobaculia bacterium]HUM30921.1 M28 family peptidase [Thermoanaerobaculia bacterium]HXK69254.1 M28 family peptidase [Thermoanaerobaculia bacterium]